MAKTVHRLDEEEKKIIDLIRQHKLDYIDIDQLFKMGAKRFIEIYGHSREDEALALLQRDLDKYTNLLEALEKGE